MARYALAYRHEATEPNALWQADHTEPDIQIVDADGTLGCPWPTLIIDNGPRAVAGYSLSSAHRQRFAGPCGRRSGRVELLDSMSHGLPDALYVDHGSDFTSIHLQRVAADLHIELIRSAITRPQGRGKAERLSARSPPSCCQSCSGTLSTAGRQARRGCSSTSCARRAVRASRPTTPRVRGPSGPSWPGITCGPGRPCGLGPRRAGKRPAGSATPRR